MTLREKKADEFLRHFRKLAGRGTVFLPIARGKKAPRITAWQERTQADMKDPDYWDDLLQGNIGVLLGKASNYLCSIDIDEDDAVAPFLAVNPLLTATLRTKGRRGCNLWVRVRGEYPASVQKIAGFGEWRADGGQTVVYGLHPLGGEYRILIEHPVVELDFADIVWPSHLTLPWAKTGLDPSVRKLIDEHGDPVQVSKGGAVQINHPFFADKFGQEHPVKFDPQRESFYEYDEATGVWICVTDASLKRKFSKDLGAFARETDLESIETKRTDALLGSLVNLLKAYVEQPIAGAKPQNMIHFRNGMLDTDAEVPTLKSFAPEYYSTNQVPYDYDPAAEAPRFEEFLLSAVDVDDAKLILRWCGMALTGRNFAQVMLLLTGVGGAGKGTLVNIITGILGEANHAQLRTTLLADRFECSRYLDKTLLLGQDVPGDFPNRKGAQVLKSLTGDDAMDTELKGRNGGVRIRGDFNVCITSNQRLRVALDGDHEAWRRRLLIVEFKKAVAKKVPNLAQEIVAKEASGIINLMLDGLGSLRKRIAKHGGFRLTGAQAERVGQLLSESDSLRAFLESAFTRREYSDVTNAEIVAAYQRFCDRSGWVPEPNMNIYKQLPQLMHELFAVSARHDIPRHGLGKRGYKGLSLNVEGDHAEP